MDYQDVARKIFSGKKYEATEADIKRLADNIALLEKRGLGKLNKRLIDSGRELWSAIAEHNFAVILISRHEASVPISYEPDIDGRPPDFKVEIGGLIYWIQMKDLAKLERENRQDKMIQKIKTAAKEVKVGKFFSCVLSNNFKEDSVPELIDFMKDKVASADEDGSFFFAGPNNQRTEIKFWSAQKIALSELTLGYAGDMQAVNLTGLDKNQIKHSLLNAAGAFKWEVDEKNINLIVMEADNKEDIDMCDAFFGTEYEIYNDTLGHLGWNRKDDGLFSDDDISKKVVGVIAIKRKRERVKEIVSLSPEEVISWLSPSEKDISAGMTPEEIKEALEWRDPGPISDYSLILYMNEKFKHLLEDIKKLLRFDKVVYYNMRPPMGHDNFKLSD